jgi:hypothetical protein
MSRSSRGDNSVSMNKFTQRGQWYSGVRRGQGKPCVYEILKRGSVHPPVSSHCCLWRSTGNRMREKVKRLLVNTPHVWEISKWSCLPGPRSAWTFISYRHRKEFINHAHLPCPKAKANHANSNARHPLKWWLWSLSSLHSAEDIS